MNQNSESKIPYQVKYPHKAVIEPTRACNLHCPTCPAGNGSTKSFPDMTFSMYKRIIDNISGFVRGLSLFNYGEPLLHPEIARFVKYAKDSGIELIKIYSNGLLLDSAMARKLIKAGLDVLKISIDGINQETYSKYRIGGDFNKLLKNINNLIRIRSKMSCEIPRIEAQYMIMSHNESYLMEFKQMFEHIGVDSIRYKTFNAGLSWNTKRGTKFLPKTSLFSRYEDKSATKVRERYNPSLCPWPRKMLVINCDGTLVPCCYDFNNDNPLGNVKKATFEEWWNTKQRREFLNILTNDYRKIVMCRNCHRGIINLNL